MFGNNPSPNRPLVANDPRQSIFMGGMSLVANVAAFVTSALMSPMAYSATVDFIVDHLSKSYGEEFSGLVRFGWFVAVSLAIFGIARAVVAVAIMSAATAIAVRLFA